MTIIGYARVSTDGQSLQSQTEALHLAGCGKVYSEKQSGAYTDRPQLAKAIAALAQGDCLVVCKLDRLARSTRDLLNTLAAIADAGASFRSLADQWADTTTPHGRLMLTVLGGLAEFERHLILTRTSEGRARAQANGVRFGRRPSLTPYQRAEALRRRAQGEMLTDIAKLFGVSHMTIARIGEFEIAVLAKRRARIAVKAELKARGVQLSYVPVAELAELARDFLMAHRAELVALATAEWSAISKPCARR